MRKVIIVVLMLFCVSTVKAQSKSDTTRVNLDTMNITFFGPFEKGDTLVTIRDARNHLMELRNSMQHMVGDFDKYARRAGFVVDSLRENIDSLKKELKKNKK